MTQPPGMIVRGHTFALPLVHGADDSPIVKVFAR